ncbi:uncharacterized protein J4E84_005167 [Alternaria hordeiaustralica]|uniref:uncharacterized protein n=1 Tax=Alternaria hordeiaustralica TaxID=1187925 RepID=UPI0020C2E158|nr:uncharacterized protein J4E84_005167 [Alternaria hordeiaustralica]KAI4688236.1 hypothetical protein J4E84_005167 [Alternaria hordeiaustralica]
MNSNNPSTPEIDDSITDELDYDFFARLMQQNTVPSSSSIAPVASTHPGPIEQDGFSQNDQSLFDYGDNFPLFPSESLGDNGGYLDHQGNMYTPGESVPGQSAHDWNLQGGHNQVETGHPYQRENNVAFGSSSSLGNDFMHHPPVTNHNAPVINHPVATGDSPAPQLSENKDAGTGEQAAEGADSAGAVKSTTPKHILEKEKQARAAIRKLKAKTSMDGQMGESITMVRTNTGVEFSGTMWKAPANDMTIPTTEKEIKACVDALDVAMHNVLNIREKADVKSSNNRWNSESKYYFPEEYNAAAGLLVKELIKIHTDGWTKQIFDQNEREQCQLTQFYTFEDRFEGLRELLHYSKTSCQDIMKGSRFYTIIANPRNLIHRTATNKTANVNKGQQIRAGKKAIKKASSAAASSSGEDKGDKATQKDDEEGSNSEESTKVKKASRGKKRAREETFVAEDPAGQAPRKKAPVKKRRSE